MAQRGAESSRSSLNTGSASARSGVEEESRRLFSDISAELLAANLQNGPPGEETSLTSVQAWHTGPGGQPPAQRGARGAGIGSSLTVSSSDSADVTRSARTSVSSATSTYAPPPAAASRRGSGKEAEDTSRSSTSLKRFGSAIAVPMDVVPPTTVTALPTLSSAHGTFAPQAAPPTTSAPPSVAAPAAEHRPASAVLRAAAGSGLFMSKRTLSRMTFDDSNGASRATSAAGSRRPSYMAMNAEGDEGEDYLEEYHAPEAADEAALARIASLRRQIDAQSVSGYADEFDEIAAAEEIVVGLVPEEEIKRREQELELSRLLAEQDSAKRFAYREAALAAKEARARDRVLKEKAELAERIRRRDAENEDMAAARSAALHRTFRRAEAQLKSTLASQHALVSEKYGELVPGRAGTRMLRVEWHKLPQPVEFRISRLRAVKNKLSAGRYVLLVTLYDRLGGNPLRWKKIGIRGGGGDSSLPGASTPVRHRGRFYDTEVTFNQCIYSVAPSQVDLRPSNVFIFELFMLGGRSNPIDRVVAWSCLPACDRDFRVSWGRFKLPMMRGEVDMAMTRYRLLEKTMERDLDTWLCNLYVEAVHLPRETIQDGQLKREYEVELAYTSEMLRIRGEYRAPKRWVDKRKLKSLAANASTGDGRLAAIEEAEELLGDADEGREEGDDDDNSEASAFSQDEAAERDFDDDWQPDLDVERDDHIMGGPGVVTDMITRDAIMAVGPVGSAPAPASAPSSANTSRRQLIPAASSAALTDASLSGSARAGGGAGGLVCADPNILSPSSAARANAARKQAEFWRARAAAMSNNVGGGTPNAGGAQQQQQQQQQQTAPPPPLSTPKIWDVMEAARSAGGGGSVGGLKVGAAFNARVAQQKGMAGRTGGFLHDANAMFGRVEQAAPGAAGAGGIAGSLGKPLLPTSPAAAAAAGAAAAAAAGVVSTQTSGLSAYTYALNKQEGRGLRGARVRESVRKLTFLKYELVADLNPGAVWTFEFWIQFVLLLIAFWLRIYLHYLGQWLYLAVLRVPVYELTPLPYAATLKYVPDVLPNEVEIGTVIMGPLGVILVFMAFMFVSWASQRILRHFPEIPSRFIAYFGMMAVLDPVLIAIVDAAAGRFNCAQRFQACADNIVSPACKCSEGDAWKLYQRFYRDEGSGVVGVILTVFIYAVLMILAAFLLYVFLLNLHLNGRMIDLFRRMHAEEAKFFVPHDFEVSPAELAWIVSRAQRWRGPRGTTRRIAVCDYVLTDPLDLSFREVTTHLIIYHSGLDGHRELYRHFLRLPDGTLLEVFGSMERQLGFSGGVGSTALQSILMTQAQRDEDDGLQRFFQGL